MNGIVSYEIGTGKAWDEDGQDIELGFCLADNAVKNPNRSVLRYQSNCVLIWGTLHLCSNVDFLGNVLSFWVRPAPIDLTIRNVIDMDKEIPSPVATYETVVETFNRLTKLEREGHHGGPTFYVAETVWGLLTSMGVVIDLWDIETLLHYHGSMIDGSFNELNVQALAMWLETVAQRLGGEV